MTARTPAVDSIARTVVAVGVLPISFLFASLGALLSAYPVMVALGILHERFPAVPAFGYWPTWLLVIALGTIRGRIQSAAADAADRSYDRRAAA